MASSFLYKVVAELIKKKPKKKTIRGMELSDIEMTSQRHQSVHSGTMILDSYIILNHWQTLWSRRKL